MQAEFEFVCQTSVPSIEYEVTKDILKFRQILKAKLPSSQSSLQPHFPHERERFDSVGEEGDFPSRFVSS